MEQEPAHMVYSEEQYLDAIRDNAPATTQEVADTVGVTRQGADYRLRSLEDAGVVSSELLGNTLIWAVEGAPERRETPPEQMDDVSPTDTPAPRDDTHAGEDPVEELDLPGSGAKLERRREAVRSCYVYLKEKGEARPADFQENVYPDHPAEYTDAKDPAYSWWTNCMYKGLKQLAEEDDQLERADTSGVWRYVEEGTHE